MTKILKTWALSDREQLSLERHGERLFLQVNYADFAEGLWQSGPQISLTGDQAEAVGRALIDYSVQP